MSTTSGPAGRPRPPAGPGRRSLFSSPDTAQVVDSVLPHQRGTASGMRRTFSNAGSSLSIGLIFSLLVIGLSASLPTSLTAGLGGQGVSSPVAQQIGALPPVGLLFAAFLGINPIQSLLQQAGAPDSLSQQAQATLTGRQFFPDLISGPSHSGLTVVLLISGALTLVGAAASFFSGTSTATEDPGPGHPGPDPAPTASTGPVRTSVVR